MVKAFILGDVCKVDFEGMKEIINEESGGFLRWKERIGRKC